MENFTQKKTIASSSSSSSSSTAEKFLFPLYKVNLPSWLLLSAACDLPYGRLGCCRRCPIGYQGEPAPTTGGTFTFLSETFLVVTFHAENVEFVGLRDPDLVLC
jgi:hypothetical protein